MKKAGILLTLRLLSTILCFSQISKVEGEILSKETQTFNSDPESKAYCTSIYTNQTDDWITNVSFNSINNYSGQDGTYSYGDYTSQITGLLAGSSYTLSVTFVSNGYTQHVRAWFDWNDDDVFSSGESYYLGSGVDATLTASIYVPLGADLGDTRFRIIEQYLSDPGAGGACDPHSTVYGETEDYTVVVYSNSYCQASGGCDEYIWIVEFPDHGYSYSSGCTGYVDFAPYWLIPVPLNTSANLTVVNGNPIYPQDQCGVWVDWNRDDDFYDAYESITVTGSPGVGPYFATLVPPPGATLGECRVRIRIQYSSGTLDPCGIMPYGEVEDYRINLLPEVPCTWTGAVDNNWHNPDNWNTTNIPDATTDVIIPNATNKCWVWAANAYCKNLTVEPGTTHDLRIYDQDLTVNGNMTVYGQLTMDHPGSTLYVDGNIYWESGSSAYISGSNLIKLYGDWIFKSGSNVHLDDGEVRFSGTGTYLRNFSSNSYFNNVVVYKASSEWLSISSNTTQDIRINGNLQITAGGTLYIYSPHKVYLGGEYLTSSGYMYCYDGEFCFDGNAQNISVQLGYTTIFQFHNLKISSTGSTTILNKDIIINNNLTIESGQFISNDKTITIQGDWNNQVGPSGFDEGNGRVKWIGTSPWTEIHSNEDFYILEVDKTSSGFLNVWGPTVTCQHYDWTSGGISVRMSGVFTVYDLLDNGIYGMWGIDNTGGTINISNYGGYVDLNGQISINGGTINVYGGSTPSYWPFANDGEIQMMDGVLDFHDQGIFVPNYTTITLTESITGGTIRTAGGFWGESANFSPDYGTMEFYGSNDATIYMMNGCYLHDVIIDKLTKESTKSHKTAQQAQFIDQRSGKYLGNGTKSNTLNQTGFLDINGSLVINGGTLATNGNNIQIESDWTNNVGTTGFDESTGWVIFDGFNQVATLYSNETFNNLMLSNAGSGQFGLTIMDGLVINVNDKLDLQWSALEMNPSSELHVGGDVFIALGAGLNANDGGNILSVGGNWTNENSANTEYFGYRKGGEIVTFNGSGDQIINTDAPEETFGNIIINKPSGYYRPDDDIHIHGGLIIQDGDWWDNVTGLDHWLTGHILIEANGSYFPEGTTTFKGLNHQTYQNNGGSAIFGDIVIDKHYTKSGEKDLSLKEDQKNVKGGTLELNSYMVVYNNHTTTIEEGTLDLNGNSFKSHGDIYINDGGILEVDAGAWLSIVAGLYVNNGGQFTASGISGNNAHVWKDVVGQYDFQVKSGGSISANYTDFDDINNNGIWVQDGAFVNPANPFSNCNFINGDNTTNSARLVINTNQILNISNINFNNNPYLTGAYNIAKAVYQGEVNITTTGGDFTGPLYEYDPDNRIHWTDYVHGSWTGIVSSDWFDPMNWGDFVVPNVASDVVIPAGTPNDPVITNNIAVCSTAIVESGASLEIGNNNLEVDNNLEIYGELILTNSMGKVYSPNVHWHAGSTDNIMAGEFHVSLWEWQDGTNASLGTGNTVFIDFGIIPNDADAAFGNLVITPDAFTKGEQNSKGIYPVRIDGNCLMETGITWSTSTDLLIQGNWEIEDGASFGVKNTSLAECHGSITLGGILNVIQGSEVWTHNILNFPSTGVLTLNEGLFLCDHNLPSGWIDLLGDITLSLGSLEFPNANISFAGTSTISGGTIIAGRTVHADLPGAFQPTGGKLELVGSSSGHYVQIRNGNFVNELYVNRSAPIGIHPSSPLEIQSYLIVNSEFMAQSNTISVEGDIAINGGGVLDLDNNSLLEMANNRWINVNNAGQLKIIGTPGNEALLSHSTGYYNLSIESGGIISAEHANFEYLGFDGVNIRPGGIVDPAYSLNHCVFSDGVSGGHLLTIENIQDFTVGNAIFPTNTWGSIYNIFKNSTPGNVTFFEATGDFAGEAFEYDPYNHVHWTAPGIRLDLIVFLEGPFNGATMDTDINSILPISHPFQPTLPYFGNPLPDWFYTGPDAVPAIPNPNYVDWILVELRDATDVTSAIPSTAIATQAAFLLNDGTVLDLDGSSNLEFTNTLNDQLFVVIWHRNHIGVISANPLVQTSGIYIYDYSTGAGQAYGGSSGHKHLGSGIWGMMSGDGDGDGEVSPPDKINVWEVLVGTNGYLEGDYNMSTEVNNQDKNDYWLPNDGSGSYIPE